MNTVITRAALFVGLILIVAGVVIAIADSVGIRDYLVALSSGRSKDFRNVIPTMWVAHLIFAAGGLFAGFSLARQNNAKSNNVQ